MKGVIEYTLSSVGSDEFKVTVSGQELINVKRH